MEEMPSAKTSDIRFVFYRIGILVWFTECMVEDLVQFYRFLAGASHPGIVLFVTENISIQVSGAQ